MAGETKKPLVLGRYGIQELATGDFLAEGIGSKEELILLCILAELRVLNHNIYELPNVLAAAPGANNTMIEPGSAKLDSDFLNGEPS